MTKQKQLEVFFPDGETVYATTDFAAAYQNALQFKIIFSDGLLHIEVPDNDAFTVTIGYGSVSLHKANIDDLIDEREKGICDLAASSSVVYTDLCDAEPLKKKRY